MCYILNTILKKYFLNVLCVGTVTLLIQIQATVVTEPKNSPCVQTDISLCDKLPAQNSHFMIDFGPVRQNCPLAANGHPYLCSCCRTALPLLMLGFSGPWPEAHTNHTAHTHKTVLPVVMIHDVEYRYFIVPVVTADGISPREGTKSAKNEQTW